MTTHILSGRGGGGGGPRAGGDAKGGRVMRYDDGSGLHAALQSASEGWTAAENEIERLKAEITRLQADRDRLEAAALEQAELWGLAEGERDSVVGSYYTCRKVLQEAGIPCQFGKDGEPTTDEGTGRDLADCVGTLVARLKAAEVERDAVVRRFDGFMAEVAAVRAAGLDGGGTG
jgi:hypothetical protein